MSENQANGLANTIGQFLVNILDIFKKIVAFFDSVKASFSEE